MFPLHDENPTLRRPFVMYALIVANGLVWLLVQGAGADAALLGSICELGLIPGELTGRATVDVVRIGPAATCAIAAEPRWHTVVTSMFLHGGWFHVLGNMWFLWVFGNNVEDSMGRARFVVFYLVCGAAAAAAQVLADPASPVPMVGASGAVSGVMGAYVVLYPRVAVRTLLVLGIFLTVVRLPAYLLVGYWFVLQLVGGLVPALDGAGGGIAFWAHVGGFLAGLALIPFFKNGELVARHRAEARAR